MDKYLNIRNHAEYALGLLERKNIEYVGDSNMFANFERAAVLRDSTREEVLMDYMTKHFCSLDQMAKNPELHPIEKWLEKTTDLINYGLLLAAMRNVARALPTVTEAECPDCCFCDYDPERDLCQYQKTNKVATKIFDNSDNSPHHRASSGIIKEDVNVGSYGGKPIKCECGFELSKGGFSAYKIGRYYGTDKKLKEQNRIKRAKGEFICPECRRQTDGIKDA